MIGLQVFGLGAALIVALFYFGYGVTHWLLPRAFDEWRTLIMPFTGAALIITWDYLALYFGFNLTTATWMLLVAVSMVNGLALWERRRKWENGRTGQSVIRRAHLLLALLALAAFLASVAPLLRYGYVTIIGENWDYEFYLPLADLLRERPPVQFAALPSNPLVSLLLSRHLYQLPLGYSYLQASLNALLGIEAMDSFAVLMAVMRALGVLSPYVFFRATLKMSVRVALLASALLTFNGLWLWFTYWNFGLHLTALALRPLALALGADVLWSEQKVWSQGEQVGLRARWNKGLRIGQRLFLPALFLAAIHVTYHPALVAVLLPLGLLGVVAVLRGASSAGGWTCAERRMARRGWAFAIARHGRGIRWDRVANALLLFGLALGLSFPTLFVLEVFRREYYARTPLAVGLRDFVPPSDAYGFSLYTIERVVGHTIPTPWLFAWAEQMWDLAAPLLLGLTIGLSLYALWRLRGEPKRGAVWYPIVAAGVFYILLFRLPFLRPYPYGYLKALSLESFVLMAPVVEGWMRLEEALRRSVCTGLHFWPVAYRALGMVGVLVIFGTFVLSLEQYVKPAPPFFKADDLRVRTLRQFIPRGATILLTDRPEVQGIPMGLVAYALRGYALHGTIRTGYSHMDNSEEGVVYDYALLAREEPSARGYQTQALWKNERFALYPRERGVLAHQLVNSAPIADAPFHLALDARGIAKTADVFSPAPVDRGLTLALVTFMPQKIAVQIDDERAALELEPGLSRYSFPRIHLPATLTIDSETAGRVWVAYVQVREPNSKATGLEYSDALVISCLGKKENLSAQCEIVNPNRRRLTWKWVVRGTLAGTHEERVIAMGEASGAPQARVRIEVGNEGNLQAIRFDEDAPMPVSSAKLPDGNWRAAVEVWEGTRLLARFDVHPTIQARDGSRRIMWRERQDLPPAIIPPD